MRQKAFDDLVSSIKQAAAIRRGERRASRAFVFKPEDVRAIRQSLGKSQRDAAFLKGRRALCSALPQRILAP